MVFNQCCPLQCSPLAPHTPSPVVAPSVEALSEVLCVPDVCLHHVYNIQFPVPSRHHQFYGKQNKVHRAKYVFSDSVEGQPDLAEIHSHTKHTERYKTQTQRTPSA